MPKVTLLKIFRGDQETQYGPRKKVSIKTDQHGDTWISALFKPGETMGTDDWAVGDEVMIDISTKGDFTNFKPSAGYSRPGGQANPDHEARIKKLEDTVFGQETKEPVISQDDFSSDEQEVVDSF